MKVEFNTTRHPAPSLPLSFRSLLSRVVATISAIAMTLVTSVIDLLVVGFAAVALLLITLLP